MRWEARCSFPLSRTHSMQSSQMGALSGSCLAAHKCTLLAQVAAAAAAGPAGGGNGAAAGAGGSQGEAVQAAKHHRGAPWRQHLLPHHRRPRHRQKSGEPLWLARDGFPQHKQHSPTTSVHGKRCDTFSRRMMTQQNIFLAPGGRADGGGARCKIQHQPRQSRGGSGAAERAGAQRRPRRLPRNCAPAVRVSPCLPLLCNYIHADLYGIGF